MWAGIGMWWVLAPLAAAGLVAEDAFHTATMDDLATRFPRAWTSLTLEAFCSGNTFPNVYDALGRYIFAGVTLDF